MYVEMRQSRAVLGVLTNPGKRLSLTVATVAESEAERMAGSWSGWGGLSVRMVGNENRPVKPALENVSPGIRPRFQWRRAATSAALSVTLGRLSSNINDLTFTSQRVIYVGRL